MPNENEIFNGKRNDAKSFGYIFYSTGKMCKNNNIEIRNMRSECVCVDCFRAEQERRDKWKKDNPEEYKKSKIKYRAEKKDQVRCSYNKYNAKKRIKVRKAKIKTEFDEFVISEAYRLSKERAKETGISWHVDHMIPLNAKKVNGLHCAENIQVIPEKMNLEKNNKMWYTKRYEFCSSF